MAFVIELTDDHWKLVADLFDLPGPRGAPAQIPRRQIVNAMLFLARTGCQGRYLPERYGDWGAVWQQWRRWRANGVWERATARLAREVRQKNAREATPSIIMIDAQIVRGGRAGPTFHTQVAVAAGRSSPSERSWSRTRACRSALGSMAPSRTTCASGASCFVSTSPTSRGSTRSWPTAATAGWRRSQRASSSSSTSRPSHPAPRVHADRPALARRGRLRAARPLAATGALLRGQRGERQGVARGRLDGYLLGRV